MERGLVLVVEDEPAIAELVALYLRRDGFGVQVESSGDAALAAVVPRSQSMISMAAAGQPSSWARCCNAYCIRRLS